VLGISPLCKTAQFFQGAVVHLVCSASRVKERDDCIRRFQMVFGTCRPDGKRKSTCRSRMFLFMNLVRYSKVSISDQQAAVHELNGGSRGISKVCSKLKHGMLQKWARTDSI
jgi:hypothetical protein